MSQSTELFLLSAEQYCWAFISIQACTFARGTGSIQSSILDKSGVFNCLLSSGRDSKFVQRTGQGRMTANSHNVNHNVTAGVPSPCNAVALMHSDQLRNDDINTVIQMLCMLP